MSPASAPISQCLELAVALAQAAGREVLARAARGGGPVVERKSRRELVTDADRAAEAIIVDALRAQLPDHAVCAEEGVLSPAAREDREADWLWLVDPLDGTTNFVHGIPFYAVALSLSWRGALQLGVVHAPVLGHTYAARLGGGARRNGEALRVSATRDLGDALLATGLSYDRNEPGRDDNTARIARVVPACRDLRRLGSAQLDLCLTAAGSLDGYWETGLKPYDIGAGALIVQEAGGRVSDLAGGGAWLARGSVLASNGPLHDQLLRLLQDPQGREAYP